MNFYLTHYSKKKSPAHTKGTIDTIYTAQYLQRFIKRCKSEGVKYGIFSDKYGLILPGIIFENYDKSPNSVSYEEFLELKTNFDTNLSMYYNIYFYYLPTRFHHLYRDLLEQSSLKSKIHMITHLADIKGMKKTLESFL